MTEQPVLIADAVEASEQLGDRALCSGRLDEAIDHYEEVNNLLLPLIDVVFYDETSVRIVQVLNRTRAKVLDIRRRLLPPAPRAAELRTLAADSTNSGDLAHAAKISIDLGETLVELGDRDGAESAYRQAVALARQVDATMPELMLWAFSALVEFLCPSEESVALAHEMAANLIDREEMYHPMRAADAAYHWAIAELKFAEVAQHRMDHAIDGIARQAIEMLDDICFHDKSQALQRLVASVLRGAGRDAEADGWQADADKHEDWEWFMDQEIPGHVHLWDIRIDLSHRHKDD
jgi:tetratricopeptide (TPR) repeat protein